MFNGDNVLDNWEEIDEAVVNWEVIDEAVLNSTTQITSSAATCEIITTNSPQISTITPTSSTEATQMKLLQRSTQVSKTSSSKPTPKCPFDDMASTFQPVMMVLHKPVDEYQSANYTPPIANQTVKILRRPTQSTEPRNNDIRPKQPIKTLQQREQEYAEARLRILGSAKNPEDEEQCDTSADATTPPSTSNSSPITPAKTTPVPTTLTPSNNTTINMTANTKNNSPKIQQQCGPGVYNYFYNQQQPKSPANNSNNNNNIRTFNIPPILGLGPMGAIGQPAQYQSVATTSPSPQTQKHFMKYQQQQQYQKLPQQQNKQQQSWSPVVGGSVSTSSFRQQQNDMILRSPQGPDGTTGFQARR